MLFPKNSVHIPALLLPICPSPLLSLCTHSPVLSVNATFTPSVSPTSANRLTTVNTVNAKHVIQLRNMTCLHDTRTHVRTQPLPHGAIKLSTGCMEVDLEEWHCLPGPVCLRRTIRPCHGLPSCRHLRIKTTG